MCKVLMVLLPCRWCKCSIPAVYRSHLTNGKTGGNSPFFLAKQYKPEIILSVALLFSAQVIFETHEPRIHDFHRSSAVNTASSRSCCLGLLDKDEDRLSVDIHVSSKWKANVVEICASKTVHA